MSDKRELSRAEVARRRRAQRAVKEMEQTKKQATRPIVPVTSRARPAPVSARAAGFRGQPGVCGGDRRSHPPLGRR